VSSEESISCHSILSGSTKLFDEFLDELRKNCSDWENRTIRQLDKVSPNTACDFDILEKKINSNVSKFFKLLFEYKQSLNYFNHICQGYLNLPDLLEIQVNNHEKIPYDMLRIDENTNGATFSMIYRNFQEHYYERYSRDMNKLVSYFGKSSELIKFLRSVSASDIDNLREAVNDRDDTLMNTKATLDLVKLKTFLDKIYNETKTLSNITLDQIIQCFESVLNDDSYINIYDCFQSCLTMLSSIKKIHSSLTDTGLSKRQ